MPRPRDSFPCQPSRLVSAARSSPLTAAGGPSIPALVLRTNEAYPGFPRRLCSHNRPSSTRMAQPVGAASLAVQEVDHGSYVVEAADGSLRPVWRGVEYQRRPMFDILKASFVKYSLLVSRQRTLQLGDLFNVWRKNVLEQFMTEEEISHEELMDMD